MVIFGLICFVFIELRRMFWHVVRLMFTMR